MKPGFDYIAVGTPFYCNDGKGKFLLHKRSNKCRDEQGRWDFGSGQLHFGEQPERGVLREVYEEYGVKGRIQQQLPAHSIIRNQNGFKTHWIVIPFFIKVNPKQVFIRDKEKISEIGWFTLKNLPSPFHTGAKYTMRKYRKWFKKYQK